MKSILIVEPGEQFCKERFLRELTNNPYEFLLLLNSSPRVATNGWYYQYVPPERVLSVEFRDPEEAARDVRSQLRSRGITISGVTTYYEEAVLVAQAIAVELSLIPITTGDPLALRNKGRMRRQFVSAGLPQPKSISCKTVEEAQRAVRDVGPPCVIKPIQMASSIGVRKVCSSSPDEVRRAFVAANTADIPEEDTRYAYNIESDVLVEEYIPTYQEISCEGFVEGERVHLVAVTKKSLCKEPFFKELGHVSPFDVGNGIRMALESQMDTAAHALKLYSTAFHAEFRLRKDAPPVLVELGARLAGGFIPQLVKLSQGVDMLAGSVQLSCGEPFVPRPAEGGVAAIQFLTSDESVRRFRTAAARIRMLPFVDELALYGDSGTGRLGHIIWTGRDFDDLELSRVKIDGA